MTLLPNRDAAASHIRALHADHPNHLFELRALDPNNRKKPISFIFSGDGDANDAAQWALHHNALGLNIHPTVASRNPRHKGASRDDQMREALFVVADCDNLKAYEIQASHHKDGKLKPEFVVTTGTKPTKRCHSYYRTATPLSNQKSFKIYCQTLIAKLDSDPAVSNMSRVMKLAGTINHPSEAKKAKGYEPELVTIEFFDHGEKYSLDDLSALPTMRAESEPAPKTTPHPSGLNLMTPAPLSKAEELIAGIKDDDRHDRALDAAYIMNDNGVSADHIEARLKEKENPLVPNEMADIVKHVTKSPPKVALPSVPTEKPSLQFDINNAGSLKEPVQALAKQSQAPEPMVYSMMLAAAATSVQHLANLEHFAAKPVPASLMMLQIAKSGERKTQVSREAIQAIRQFEREKAVDYKKAHSEFELEKQIFDAAQKEYINKKKKTADLRADFKAELPPEQPENPRILFAADTSPAAVQKAMTNNQFSVAMITDEGNAMLANHSTKPETRAHTQAFFNSAFNGEMEAQDRVTRDSCPAVLARLTVSCGIQPKQVNQLLTDGSAKDSGFLARWLCCYPKSNIGSRFFTGEKLLFEEEAALDQYHDRIKDALEIKATYVDDRFTSIGRQRMREPVFRLLPLSDDAQRQLIDFYNEVERRQLDELSDHTDSASKITEQALRIAGVSTLHANPRATEMSGDAMRQAIGMARYFLSENIRLTEGAIADERWHKLRDIITHQLPDVFTPSDAARVWTPKASRKVEKVTKDLLAFQEAGVVKWVGQAEIGGIERENCWQKVLL
jgi:hypothetical protein